MGRQRRRGRSNRGTFFVLGFISSLSLAFAPSLLDRLDRPPASFDPGEGPPRRILPIRPAREAGASRELERRRSKLLVRLENEAKVRTPAGDIFKAKRILYALRRGIVTSERASELDYLEGQLEVFLKSEILPDGRMIALAEVSRLVDRFGEALGVYDLLKAAGAAEPRDFVLALIRTESAFDAEAVSRKGAVGLMQVMPRTAAGLGVQGSLLSPETNIEAGMKYLRECLLTFGRLDHALAGYNSGVHRTRTSLDGSGTIPSIFETRHYVKKVMREYDRRLRERSTRTSGL